MKIAIIKTGGKQYKVAEGQTVKIEKLKAEEGASVAFETLLVSEDNGDNIQIGEPSLGDKVSAQVIKTAKGDKVTVVKYKNKTRYKKTTGHRQMFTAVKITSIA
jgi:large subunit ribosomal protein L21